MNQLIMVYVTINNSDNAQRLARTVVERGLVACVNIIPAMQSCYVWEGKFVQDNEIILIMKTLAHKYDELEREIIALHPYEVPCIVKIAASANQSFMDFVTRAVK